MREKNLVLKEKLVKASLGEIRLDLLLKNCNLVNVYSGEILETDVGIALERIVSVHRNGKDARRKINCSGYYAVPGLIDAHVHLDSTLLTPRQLARIILPRGTTSVLIDPMETANVLGIRGVKILLKDAWSTPLKTFVQISSRVPTAPGLETTGAKIELDEIERAVRSEWTVALGEMDPSKIIPPQRKYMARLITAEKARKIRVGHAAGLSGSKLEAYVSAGLGDDHECVTAEEALERIRLGMKVMVREGSSERNLEDLVKVISKYRVDSRHLFFCTDDKHPDDIIREGHIDYNVREAIELGVDPIEAIQMATLNCAEHFGLDNEIGSIAPGRIADIILVRDLKEFKPEIVIANGELVAKDGKFLKKLPKFNWPKWSKNTVKLKSEMRPEDFIVGSKKEVQKVRVIKVIEGQIINEQIHADLRVVGGEVQVDLEKDVIKIACVERHKRTGNLAVAFVSGFGIKDGAIASSVAHDHHNIVVVGANDRDMAIAVNEIARMKGGLIAVKRGAVLAKLELPIAGLMSELRAEAVIERLDMLNLAVKELGCKLKAPFMTLSFISLPTVPELGLTDKGLIDVKNHKIISPLL
jgi:adenine deaminase